MKIIKYNCKYKLDKKIKKFILNILIEELKQDKSFERPDLDNFLIYKKNGGDFWILIDNNLILGTIAIKIENNTAILKRFFIEKNIRKKGYGKKLYFKAINFCKNKKIKKIILNNDSTKMQTAYDFYIKKGFKETYRREDGYVSMELKLD